MNNSNALTQCIYKWKKPYYMGNSILTLNSLSDTWIGENNLEQLLTNLKNDTGVCDQSPSVVKPRIKNELGKIQTQYDAVQRQINADKFETDMFSTSNFDTFHNTVSNANKKQICYGQTVCALGYQSTTRNPTWMKCGVHCSGGLFWTDGSCNCACIPEKNCVVN